MESNSQMKPTQEQIDAAIYNIKSPLNYIPNQGEYYLTDLLRDTILAALKAYRPVDVEELARKEFVKDETIANSQAYKRDLEAIGWNSCLRHLIEKGIINGTD